MVSFPLQLIDGHAIIESVDHQILIDTGSPKTIHTSTTLDFMGKSFSCLREFGGVNSARLSALIGSPVTTLLGMDIISQFKVLFDYSNHRIWFSETDMFSKGAEIPLGQVSNIPIMELEVLGRSLKFLLDSGAKLSYLETSLTKGLPSQEAASDFHPSYGAFETPIYTLECTVVGATFPVTFGNLPSQLAGILPHANVQGIIGFDLFNRFQVLLNMQENKLQLN